MLDFQDRGRRIPSPRVPVPIAEVAALRRPELAPKEMVPESLPELPLRQELLSSIASRPSGQMPATLTYASGAALGAMVSSICFLAQQPSLGCFSLGLTALMGSLSLVCVGLSRYCGRWV